MEKIDVEKEIESGIHQIKKISPKEGEIIVFEIEHNMHTDPYIAIFKGIKKALPEFKIVAIPKGMKISIENKENLIKRIQEL